MIPGIKVFKCGDPLVVPPLVQTVGHRSLKTVNFGFESGVPGFLPLPPQPVLQTYFILDRSRKGWPWVETLATLGSCHLDGTQDSTGQVPDTRVDSLFVTEFRIGQKLLLQAFLESGPISPFEVWTVREVRKLERHIVSISNGRCSELSEEQTVRLTGVTRFLVKKCPTRREWQTVCKE